MNRFRSKKDFFLTVLKDRYPSAKAEIVGLPDHPEINGSVDFYATPLGVILSAEIFSLPEGCEGSCTFGFHIHEGGRCRAQGDDPFGEAGEIYGSARTGGAGSHAGDLPSLISNGGYAWLATLTGRFQIEDIKGKTIVIHSISEGARSQSCEGMGKKIACGEIA